MFTILCMLCLLAPSVSRWAAYVHCKIAEASLDKDCGCDTIITQQIPESNHHTAPAELVQHVFSQWHFEKSISIQLPVLSFAVTSIYAFPGSDHLPKDLVQSIFHPPGC
ncbi:MAG: hypothetical protein V4722_28410 [Bacteroidota bacterium]